MAQGKTSCLGTVLAVLGALAGLTLVVLLASGPGGAARAQEQEAPPGGRESPSPGLEAGRFAGTWYVVATIPDRFHRDCGGNATVTYTQLPDDRLRVQNRCTAGDGSVHRAEGVARIPADAPDRLELRYAPDWMGWLPLAWSELLVFGIAPDYGAALEGTPDREHLWLLSRSPVLGQTGYERLVALARRQGFEVDRLQYMPQEGGSATSVEEGVEMPAP